MEITTIEINESQLQILQHSLGVDEFGEGNMYRNHFSAGGDDIAICESLVATGLMACNSPGISSSYPLYSVTDVGKRLMMEKSKVEVSSEQIGILLHALGLDQYGQGEIYRKHFCAGGKDLGICESLVDIGAMARKDPSALTGGDALFLVTARGIAIARAKSEKPPKLTKSKRRYKAYLRSETDESFIDWLTNSYWDEYRISHNC